MAKVFLAHDLNLDRQVALKVLLPHYANDPAFIDFFQEEAVHVARLDSPRIVKVFDRGIGDDGCYIVMEYVDGFSLRNVLKKHGAFSPAAAARIAYQVCEALEVAHGRDVIHNDLKPANILMTRTGDIKITDFGIAKMRTPSSRADEGRKHYIAGTGCYMSPERASGTMTLPASDLYSLGVTLFELCMGSATLKSLQNPTGKLDGTIISSSMPDWQLGHIVSTCTKYDPEQRYSSAGELKRELAEYIESHDEPPNGIIVSPGESPLYWVLQTLGDRSSVGDQQLFQVSRPLSIGRSEHSDLRVNLASVSGTHARLTPWGACLILEDCDSLNGTQLNGAPVLKPMTCYPGDVISLGAIAFRVGCKWN